MSEEKDSSLSGSLLPVQEADAEPRLTLNVCLNYFSHFCVKISDQRSLRKKGYLAHSLRMKKSWLQEYETVTCISSATEKQEEMNTGAQLVFFSVPAREITASFFIRSTITCYDLPLC